MTEATPGVQQLIIEVPDELAAQVVEALVDTYPDVVEGAETAAQMFRAVVAWWTANLLGEYQAKKARDQGEVQIDQAHVQLDEHVRQVKLGAWKKVRDVMTSGHLPAPASNLVASSPLPEETP